jgi:hypothetical protein
MSSASDKTWELTLTIAISAFVILSILVFTFPNALAANVKLAWDANTESDLAGYKVYYGTSTGKYPDSIDVGNVTTHTVVNLVDGQTYYTDLKPVSSVLPLPVMQLNLFPAFPATPNVK